MWRKSLSSGYRCFGCRTVGPKNMGLAVAAQFQIVSGQKGLWSSHAVHSGSAPALPAGGITALEAVNLWKRHFAERGVTEPDHSSHYIIAHLFGAKTLESLDQRRLTEFLSPEKTEQMWKLCSRRLSRMPVQYVIEEWDFRDLTLKMRPPVFIPRPETEELVELMLTDLEMKLGTGVGADAQQTCLEVGCGSGAISLSLLTSLPQLKAIALDQSQDAVDLTGENALRLGLQDRLQIHHIDVMKDAETLLSLCSDVSALVSNPPYLFSEDMTTLEPEIFQSYSELYVLQCNTGELFPLRCPYRFEDHAALDGGKDGLKVIKQILTLAPQILLNHGRVYLEVDPRHPLLIQHWVEENVQEMHYVETRHDINGRPRFCILRKEKSNKEHKLDLD